MRRKVFEVSVVAAFLVVLVLPLLQQMTGIVPEPRLAEKRSLVPPPAPAFDTVASGEFQARFDRYMNDNYGLRSWIVLVNNQIDIGVFRVTR